MLVWIRFFYINLGQIGSCLTCHTLMEEVPSIVKISDVQLECIYRVNRNEQFLFPIQQGGLGTTYGRGRQS